MSWTDASTSIVGGEISSATLNCNFSCTANISSDNSNFLIGTAKNSLSESASVTFSENRAKTIYYKYTGSEDATVKMNVQDNGGNCSSEISIEASAPVAQYKTSCRFTFQANKACGYSLDIFSDDQSLCVCECPGTYTYTSSASVEKTGTADVYMTSTDSYYIKVTRIYGSTSAKILRYNGTLLDKVAASGFIGPYTGEELGIKDEEENIIILNLFAE